MSGNNDLLDSSGERILSGSRWMYKIMLADGRELAMDPKTTWAKVVPASQGMVVQYHPKDGWNAGNENFYGWPIGELGYFRSFQVADDGTAVKKGLSLNGDASSAKNWLGGYDSSDSYGFYAEQIYGNRVLLWAALPGQFRGLRVTSDNFLVAQANKTGDQIGLDVAFVRVGNKKYASWF